MRKLLLTTAAVAAAIAGAVAAEPEYGTFTDERDGKVYRTAKIGNQTWMAWNLNYKTPSGSWCYENSADSCAKYGRLYTWDVAIKACPAGYHLPSNDEWDSLVATAGVRNVAGKKLKTKKSGWNDRKDGRGFNGTNDFGFSALPGGYRYYGDGGFGNAGYSGYWWTATVDYSDYAYYRYVYYDSDNVYKDGYYKSEGLSVRCVADNP